MNDELSNAIIFLVFVNINLVLVNLLPFVGFDGGKIVFSYLQEKFPRILPHYLCFSLGGMVIFVGSIAYLTAMDIWRLIA
jgi:membrane-associated protease RseP (regulator of RpoE activity)